MLSRLQKYVEGFFESSAGVLHGLKMSPNNVTVVGFLCIIACSLAYATGLGSGYLWPLATFLLLLAGFFDAIDGAMARRYKSVSKVGGVLDSILDRLGEIAVYVGLAYGGLVTYPIAVWALSASLMVSYVRARVEVEGVTLKGIGIAERPERLLIILVATMTFPVYRDSLSFGTLLVALLATVTVAERILQARKSLVRV